MEVGYIHPTSNYGDVEIIEYIKWDNVTIRFLDTGNIRHNIKSDKIRKGIVKDVCKPSVHGVGYLGEGKKAGRGKAYEAWINMLQRCYSPIYHARQPTYKDCEVCLEWHNFQNFAKWFDVNYVEGYQLDKDIKVLGNKIYAPQFCEYVTPTANKQEGVRSRTRRKNAIC